MKICQKYIVFILFSILFLSCKSPEKVENLGIFGKSRLKEVAGQDGCSPIPVDKKYIIWTFGDTILGDWKKKVTLKSTFEESANFTGMISNSLAVTEYPDDYKILGLKFRFLKSKGRVTSFFSPGKSSAGASEKIWAIDGIKINKRLYLYYIIIKIQKNGGPLPFSITGTGLASWEIPGKWQPGDSINLKKIGMIFRGNEPTFGDSVILKDGYLYLAGHRNNGNKVNGYFARVKPAEIGNRESYSFLNREGSWTHEIRRARGFFGEVFGEFSLSYNEYLRKYIVIYCGREGRIKLAAFNEFSELEQIRPVTIYKPDKLPEIKSRTLYFYYSGKEIFSTEKYIYAIYINPAIYQPILLRIPYSVIKQL